MLGSAGGLRFPRGLRPWLWAAASLAAAVLMMINSPKEELKSPKWRQSGHQRAARFGDSRVPSTNAVGKFAGGEAPVHGTAVDSRRDASEFGEEAKDAKGDMTRLATDAKRSLRAESDFTEEREVLL